jgi:hypothetical protein
MFGIQHVGCARRIHHGPQRTLKFGIAALIQSKPLIISNLRTPTLISFSFEYHLSHYFHEDDAETPAGPTCEDAPQGSDKQKN